MTTEQKVARLAQALKELIACVADEHDEDYARTCSIGDPNGCTLCDARRALEEIDEPTVLRLECRNTLRLEVANP